MKGLVVCERAHLVNVLATTRKRARHERSIIPCGCCSAILRMKLRERDLHTADGCVVLVYDDTCDRCGKCQCDRNSGPRLASFYLDRRSMDESADSLRLGVELVSADTRVPQDKPTGAVCDCRAGIL